MGNIEQRRCVFHTDRPRASTSSLANLKLGPLLIIKNVREECLLTKLIDRICFLGRIKTFGFISSWSKNGTLLSFSYCDALGVLSVLYLYSLRCIGRILLLFNCLGGQSFVVTESCLRLLLLHK